MSDEEVSRLLLMVMRKERARCALICENHAKAIDAANKARGYANYEEGRSHGSAECAAAIRAECGPK